MRLSVLVVFVVACTKAAKVEPPPTCEELWQHLVELTPADQRADFVTLRERRMTECKTTLTDAQKRCIVAATSWEDMECSR